MANFLQIKEHLQLLSLLKQLVRDKIINKENQKEIIRNFRDFKIKFPDMNIKSREKLENSIKDALSGGMERAEDVVWEIRAKIKPANAESWAEIDVYAGKAGKRGPAINLIHAKILLVAQ